MSQRDREPGLGFDARRRDCASFLRERRPYQGGKQVAHDLIPDLRLSRTLLADKASRVLLFPVIYPIFPLRRFGRSNQSKPLSITI
jgi:hypothetical protein